MESSVLLHSETSFSPAIEAGEEGARGLSLCQQDRGRLAAVDARTAALFCMEGRAEGVNLMTTNTAGARYRGRAVAPR